MSNVLTEELGPRGRRRVRIATWIAVAMLAALAVLVIQRLQAKGQLNPQNIAGLFEPGTLKFFGEGLWATVKAAVVASVISVVVGFGLALMRLSKTTLVRGIGGAWIELFRALPLLLNMVALAALDIVLAGAMGSGQGPLGVFGAIVLALVLYNSAVLAEIFRSGVLSLDRGQGEAASAVGMTYWQSMFLVILPQAVRRMIPAIVAQIATLTKDVSLGSFVLYEEFVLAARGAPRFSDVTAFQAFVFMGLVYFVMIWALARLADYLAERQKDAPTVMAVDPEEVQQELPA